MSEVGYQRKYRSKSLSEYIGNEHMKTGIIDILKNGNRPQVILLDGNAGCGKTTFARLVAKEYTCENRDDEHGACGVCEACQAMDRFIESGLSDDVMNVKEVNNSNENGKNDIDRIIDDIFVPSFDGGWKVYIFDECHGLSNAAQNSLLKVLEEPPEKVLMILCTTDPDKLLPTIRSRCQCHYTVTKPDLKTLCGLLKKVCIKEGVSYDDRALQVIATSSDFVPRQALIMLDRVVSSTQSASYEGAVKVLDVVADTQYFEFYKHLTSKHIDVFKYIKFLSQLKEQTDLKKFIDGLRAFTLRGIYIYNGVQTEGLDTSEIRRYKSIFSSFSQEDMVYLLNLLNNIKPESIELTLMLIGYQGILGVSERMRGTSNADIDLSTIKDDGKSSVVAEVNFGTNEFQAMRNDNTETRKNIESSGVEDMSIEDLADMFGGEIVKG